MGSPGDFETGRVHLVYVLTIKLEPWSRIPLRLCALAIADRAVIRDTASECLRQYRQNPDPELHHRVSVAFCDPTSRLHDVMASDSAVQCCCCSHVLVKDSACLLCIVGGFVLDCACGVTMLGANSSAAVV
jgi:hypothetical protein